MADPTANAPTAPYEKHRAQLKAILLAWGMPEDNAETTADILSWADLHGVDSHGLSITRRIGFAAASRRARVGLLRIART